MSRAAETWRLRTIVKVGYYRRPFDSRTTGSARMIGPSIRRLLATISARDSRVRRSRVASATSTHAISSVRRSNSRLVAKLDLDRPISLDARGGQKAGDLAERTYGTLDRTTLFEAAEDTGQYHVSRRRLDGRTDQSE